MILRRYMTQQVASNTAIVLFFLLALMLGGRLIRYFGIAAEGRLDLSFLFAIIGYSLPALLELILPLSFFIALMLVFGRMYVDNEMSVINGSGMSRGRLARMMLPLILGIFILESGLTLWAKPWGVSKTDSIWQKQALTSALDLIKPQTFITSQNYHLYVGAFDKRKRELQDVYLIQKKSSTSSNDKTSQPPKELAQKDIIVMAKRAVQVPSSDDDPMTRLDLFEGKRYEVGVDSLIYNQVSFDSYRISLQKPANDKVNETNIETQATLKLLDNLNKPAAVAELGYRFSLPWLMIIAVMLAVPLAQVSPRQGRWARLIPAILIFVSCAIGLISLKTAISKQKISVYAYVGLIVGFMVFALYLNWQSRVSHRLRYRRKTTNQPNSSASTGVKP